MNISLSDAWVARLECAMRKSDFIFRYRVRNWHAYNRALVRRGSITFWVDLQAIAGWCRVRAGRQGGVPSDPAGDTGISRVRRAFNGHRAPGARLRDGL